MRERKRERGRGKERGREVRVCYVFVWMRVDWVGSPVHYVMDRMFFWPFVISCWFQPHMNWPSPWSVTYVQMLEALLSFFHSKYALPDGRHPLCLNEDEYDTYMQDKQATHTLIPFDLHPIGRFLKYFQPISHIILTFFLSPLLRWFVGPMFPYLTKEPNEPLSVDIFIPSCRFLSESKRHFGEQKGNEMCVKLCAISMEHIMKERMSFDVHLLPNLQDGSCLIRASPRPVDECGCKKRYLDCASLDW